MPRILEIACFNLASALTAQSAGADRIELCENYSAGGITPANDLILQVRREIQIPVHVIIRPRAGDFIYSEQELREMEQSIAFCKAHQVDGVVLGVLTRDRKIDLPACEKLIALARPMSLTFHRAFDSVEDHEAALRDLVGLGINRVLSSGGKQNASEAILELKQWQQKFGEQIIIMPGGGLRASNIKQVLETGCREFHSAALMPGTDLADSAEIKRLRQFL